MKFWRLIRVSTTTLLSDGAPENLREIEMRLTKIGYYSELFVYPVLIAALAVAGIAHAGPLAACEWISIFFGFLVLWTLIEYVLHRFVFHHIPIIQEMHHHHHCEERSFIGTPLWVSLAAHCTIVFLPILALSDLWLASAASCGLATGYIWYVAIHHILHHWHPSHSSYLYRLKRHHALHHHVDPSRNFGVTTSVWDWVFGTLAKQSAVSAVGLPRIGANGPA
jgi:sterol desaturase/sphingolipid hydroxylase (fatty acid hydroxylase superfamily)